MKVPIRTIQSSKLQFQQIWH